MFLSCGLFVSEPFRQPPIVEEMSCRTVVSDDNDDDDDGDGDDDNNNNGNRPL